jgi:hypothetical protein
MTTVCLVLNSSNVFGAAKTSFRYNFIQGSFSIPEDSEICVSSVVIPYSWYNVNQQLYSNAQFSYVFPVCTQFVGASISLATLTLPANPINGQVILGMTLTGGSVLPNTVVLAQLTGTPGQAGTYTVSVSQATTASGGIRQTLFPVTLQNGFYQVSDINNALQNQLIANGHYLVNASGQNVYFLSVVTNVNFYANQILWTTLPTTLGTLTNPANMGLPNTPIAPQWQITNSPNGTLIGYTVGLYPSIPATVSGNTLSNTTPNLTTVNSVVVRCNLVNNMVATPSDIMTSFPIDAKFGSNINFSPSYEQWVGVTAGKYSSISLTLQDQNFNTIQANDVNCLITMLIRIPKKL